MKRAVLVLVALFGCGEDEPSCGDGVCDTGETMSSCRGDCPPPGCPVCTGYTTCGYHACILVWAGDGTYVIELNSAVLPSAREDTTPWDADGPPDPYVTVSLGTKLLGSSQKVSDTLTPTWNHPLSSTTIHADDQLRLDVFDEDGTSDELMYSCVTGVQRFFFGAPSGVYNYLCKVGTSDGDPEVRFQLTKR